MPDRRQGDRREGFKKNSITISLTTFVATVTAIATILVAIVVCFIVAKIYYNKGYEQALMDSYYVYPDYIAEEDIDLSE